MFCRKFSAVFVGLWQILSQIKKIATNFNQKNKNDKKKNQIKDDLNILHSFLG